MSKEWPDVLTAITGAVSMVLWGAYVFYTRQTFKEIQIQTRELQKQSKLQTEALLMVRADIVDVGVGGISYIDQTAQELSEQWKVILEKNFPDGIKGENQYLKLRFDNRGRSDITRWTVKFHMTIEPGTGLLNALGAAGISGKSLDWEISCKGTKHYIAPNEGIDLVVAKVGCFPIADISWSIDYGDAMGNSPRCHGDKNIPHKNRFANP